MDCETVLAASRGYSREGSAINEIGAVRKNLEKLNIVVPKE